MSRFCRTTNSIIAAGLLCASCGGKGGLPGAHPDEPSGPLTIVSVTPADGATGIAPDAPLSVVFSRAIAPPATGALALEGPAGPQSGVVAVSGSTLTFSATELAEPGTTLEAKLAAGVVATDGGDPAPALSWHFSLRADRAWSNDSLAAGDQPDLVLDDAGRIYASWRSAAGGAVLASWAGAAGWQQTSLGAGARDVALAAGDTRAWAVWADGKRLLSTSSQDGRWQSATTLSDGAKRIGRPRLALVAGSPIAIWERAGGEIFATGPALASPVRLSAAATLSFDPRISAANGHAVAVWRESNGAHAWMAGASFDGTTWSGRTILSTASSDAYDPAVLALDDGAIACWSQRSHSSSTAPSLWYAKLSGGTWSAPQVLFDPLVTGTADVSGAGAGGITAPMLSSDGAGGAWLTWRERDGKTMASTNLAALRASHFQGGAFGPPVTLDDGANGDPAQAAIAFDAPGSGAIAWQRGYGPATRLLVSGATATGFGAPEIQGDAGEREPRIAKRHGREARMWRQADGTIAVSRFD